MTDEYDPNAALFGGEEPEKGEDEVLAEHLFGKNPNRTSAISDLFSNEMMAAIDEDTDLPEEAKRKMIFKMTANSVLDMIMECLPSDMAADVAAILDGYIGMCMVNKTYSVDLLGELQKAISELSPEEGESDEDFDRRLSAMEEAWWSIPQPKLDGRNPEDSIREMARRYGLDG